MGRGRPRKYFTEEERKAAQREYTKQYREKHPEYMKQYQEDHKEELVEYQKQYREEHKEERAQYRKDHKEERAEYAKQYYQDHKDEIAENVKKYIEAHKEEMAEKVKQYHLDHKEEIAEYRKQYIKTPKGRAVNLIDSYRQNDKKYNRGKCAITSNWIVENVFSGQVCHYCGESDWKKLGVDRIDNSKPHTPENVVVCCGECNVKKHTTEYQEFMRLIGKIN